MKKKVSIILLSAIFVLSAILFCACDNTANKTPAHTHEYSTEWSSDDTYHWHNCLGCTEVSDKAEHDYDDGVVADGVKTYTCETCGHTWTEIVGFNATFTCDEHVSVLIYPTQDVSGEGFDTNTAVAKSGEDGSILIDGTGQINYKVVLDEGYAIDQITVTGTYNKNKNDPDGTGATDVYRITKVQSDLTVEITTSLSEAVEGQKVTFNIADGITVTVFDTQDTTAQGTVVNSGEYVYAKTASGVVSKTGEEQVNFVISFNGELEVEVTAEGSFKNLKIDPEAMGDTNIYRITKVTGEVTVNVTIK